ncbi:UDP-2,3-diacylglucosamine diphosphatase [Legionella impletisoli]|uniref:UDP-2,3-diacylglucosamine hydrolase n=1 Tax=Legionella impletisoli TaxID=343510 RepID=A0A917N7Z0_9GAMM|nr:UDP-2,3-diacylglucosamine diphosphatase [Legionella impletisoli]GGI76174.1 UDP-2,3-diacylglucosamine hydrolase [Legionella impletisoli]
MIDAVFISDLHLNPEQPDITERFFRFIDWASHHTSRLFILGDFFHAWPGDDALDGWSESIAHRLAWLTRQGVQISYLRGNRDFLIGQQFAKLANITILTDPHVLKLNQELILLTHGDQYCLRDVAHQWLRRLTRNRIFFTLFQVMPLKFREKIVLGVRQHSQQSNKSDYELEIVPEAMIREMDRNKVEIVIHGHIHKPEIKYHEAKQTTYKQIVLSDWDDIPHLLCYDKSNGFYFDRF